MPYKKHEMPTFGSICGHTFFCLVCVAHLFACFLRCIFLLFVSVLCLVCNVAWVSGLSVPFPLMVIPYILLRKLSGIAKCYIFRWQPSKTKLSTDYLKPWLSSSKCVVLFVLRGSDHFGFRIDTKISFLRNH